MTARESLRTSEPIAVRVSLFKFMVALHGFSMNPWTTCVNFVVATRTFFALGSSRFCVTPGNYVMAFFSLSVFKQSLLCLVVIFHQCLLAAVV